MQSLASFNSNLSAAIAGSQTPPLQKGHQPNLVSASGNQLENGGELNMEDASPRTDTSTDGDADDRNQGVCILNSLRSERLAFSVGHKLDATNK